MKIKGSIMLNTLMFQMEIEQEGYLSKESIIFSDNQVWIDASGIVTTTKEIEALHVIPIKRTGPGKEDFEIDFNIAFCFYNQKLEENEVEEIKKNKYMIGPYSIPSEMYKQSNYQNQTYPRLDIIELMNALVNTNKGLEVVSTDKDLLDDKKILRRLIKDKLSELGIETLKSYRKYFTSFSEEESNGGEFKNYSADEKLLKFTQNLITTKEAHLCFEDMSVEELRIHMETAKQEEAWERVSHISNLIIKKSGES